MLIECFNCGAPLDVKVGQSLAKCRYCDRPNRIQQARTLAQQTPQGWRPPPVWVPPQHVPQQSQPLKYHAGPRLARILIPIVIASTLVPLAISLFGMFAHSIFSQATTQSQVLRGIASAAGVLNAGVQGGRESSPGNGGYTPLGEHMQWNSRSAPEALDIDGDDVEDFVGLYQVLDSSKQEVFLGGFKGKQIERAWKVGPLSDMAGSQHVRFAVTGDRVAVSDVDSVIHVVSAKDGTELRALKLSDRAEQLCANPSAPGQIWIAQVDKQTLMADMASGKTSPARRPDWCPDKPELIGNSECWSLVLSTSLFRVSQCLSPKKLGKVAGFKAEYALSFGNQLVAVGNKDPGTRIPMIAGYASAQGAALWSRPLVESGEPAEEQAPKTTELVDGRLLVQYDLRGGGGRLQAADASNGKVLWDVEVPRSDSGSEASLMRVTKTRVYLPHWTWLDIFDVKTGQEVATVGIW
ncbi:MAG TPA: PQQ-binding-like beta-propeller repeat protein [Polyangiaceae bacterium]